MAKLLKKKEELVIEELDLLQRELPQLIVALDSADESANYIHIADAKENINYYCPCCKGLIKPRAYKKDIKYQVQPHFYHESGGCSEESFVHYICKTWLFENGCKFIVNGTEYTVKSIETEKTLHTSFGDYRPDIIVNTKSDKTFFFEIKYSNRKTELYAPKWDELGNDVVEVDTREFINNKHNYSIPEFKLIYSNGECFIKSYSRTDYEDTIAKRKLEWKRQDKLNYKIQWERLDWFWNELCEYKQGLSNTDNVVQNFCNLSFEDMDFCMNIIKKMKCQSLYSTLIPVINDKFYYMVNLTDITPYKHVVFNRESKMITYIGLEMYCVNDIFHIYHAFPSKGNNDYFGVNLLNDFHTFVKNKLESKDKTHVENYFSQFDRELGKYSHTKYHGIEVNLYVTNRELLSIRDNGKTVFSKVYKGNYFPIRNMLYDIDFQFHFRIRNTLTKEQHTKRLYDINQYVYNRKIRDKQIKRIVRKINSCKNGIWKCKTYGKSDSNVFYMTIYIKDSEGKFTHWYSSDITIFYTSSIYSIFNEIKKKMNYMLCRDIDGFRYMEVSNDK